MATGTRTSARERAQARQADAGPRWLDAGQQGAWRAYIMGTTLLLDRLDRDLRQAWDISLTEYEILVRLSEQPDRSLRMALLADALCHSRSRITHTIARMEKAGLVGRTAAEGDRRGVVATMTDAGRDLLAKAAPTHVEGVREHLVDLASRADFDAVGRVFNVVSDRLMQGHDAATDIR
ncbi:MAG TPA: MarR family transcriptional regulator [Marmoricola sp.]|nr:MarR family transcriptional regulator [Marmoricola sp.]